MTRAEIRKLAEKEALFCQTKSQRCPSKNPDDPWYGMKCVMHPTRCEDVTAEMWEQQLVDVATLYGKIKEEEQ